MKKQLFLIFIFVFIFLPFFVQGLEIDYPETFGQEPTNIPEYINYIYNFALGAVGIVAILMLTIGGIKLLSSSGSPEKIKDAKDQIKQAIIGLALVFLIFFILNTINPDLVVIRLPELPEVSLTPPSISLPSSNISANCKISHTYQKGRFVETADGGIVWEPLDVNCLFDENKTLIDGDDYENITVEHLPWWWSLINSTPKSDRIYCCQFDENANPICDEEVCRYYSAGDEVEIGEIVCRNMDSSDDSQCEWGDPPELQLLNAKAANENNCSSSQDDSYLYCADVLQ